MSDVVVAAGSSAVAGVLGLLLVFLVRAITAEAMGWLPALSWACLRSAAKRLPVEYQERYAQEWRAELATLRDRRLWAIVWAIRVRVKASSMGAELERDAAATEPPRLGGQTLDAPTVAEIVAAVVERTETHRPDWGEIAEQMRGELRDTQDVSVELEKIAERYRKLLFNGQPDEVRSKWDSDRLHDWEQAARASLMRSYRRRRRSIRHRRT